MAAPFYILAGDFTVTASKDDQRCTITRTSLRHGITKQQCSLKLEDMLRKVAEMGGSYADAIEVLRRADHCLCLNCPVAVDALPQLTTVEDLARAGAGDADALKTHPEILQAQSEFGPTPTLFEKTGTPRTSRHLNMDDAPAAPQKPDSAN
jgi:hypothetical protein